FWVRAAPGVAAARHNATARIDARRVVMRGGFSHKVGRNGLTTYRLRGTSVRKLDPVESRKRVGGRTTGSLFARTSSHIFLSPRPLAAATASFCLQSLQINRVSSGGETDARSCRQVRLEAGSGSVDPGRRPGGRPGAMVVDLGP